MKVMILIPALAMLFTGCATSAAYKFDNLDDPAHIVVKDTRADFDKEAHNACSNDGTSNLGDKNIVPSKSRLFRSRLAANLKSQGQVDIVLQQFNLHVIQPDSCAYAINAAVAGATGSNISGNRRPHGEGVSCELRFKMNGRTYSGKSFVEAQEGINSLNGFSVSTKKLIAPLTQAVDACIANALR